MRFQKNEKGAEAPFANLARPERFELPTTKFVAWYSIQLSYGREEAGLFRYAAFSSTPKAPRADFIFVPYPATLLAEREGFEPSIEFLTLYSLSRGAPSASRAPLRIDLSTT